MATRTRTPIALTLLAVAALHLAGCGDGDKEADPTPAGMTGEEESSQTSTSADPGGAVGEDVGDERDARNTEDDDSQTNRADTEEPGSAVDARPALVRVSGAFGDGEVDVALAQGSTCGIDENVGVRVEGESAEGGIFRLGWDVDEAARSTFVQDGVEWQLAGDDHEIEITSNEEVLVRATYESDDGETADAQLLVNCDLAG